MKMKYLIPILFLFSSCRTVNKLFHKDKEKIDSTSVTHNVSIEEKHIDTSKTQTISSLKENSIVIDLQPPPRDTSTFWWRGVDTLDINPHIGWGQEGEVINDDVSNKSKLGGQSIAEYFLIYDKKTGKITSNQPITHVTIKGLDEIKYSNFQGGIDTTILKNDLAESTHLQKQVLKVDSSVVKKVSFTTVIYWGIGILIFLIVLYIIYRYRNQIKSFVLKATTGI